MNQTILILLAITGVLLLLTLATLALVQRGRLALRRRVESLFRRPPRSPRPPRPSHYYKAYWS